MTKNQEQIININNAIKHTSNIENAIPSVQKSTFNFKGRKSSEIASSILRYITPENGVVADPFMGSGSFAIASLDNNLTFYGNDLDNYTFNVVKTLFSKVDKVVLEKYYKEIVQKCKKDIMNLYETSCCGIVNYIDKLHFDPEGEEGFNSPEYYNPTPHRDIINNESIILVSQCPICKKKKKIFQNNDMEKIRECNFLDTHSFPSHKLIENSRINITSTHGADNYDRNYTNRAKYALLKIQNAISDLPKSNEKNFLQHCLVASLTLSRISQYGSGSEYIYQVMRKQAQEKNVWLIFESKYKNFVKYYDTYTNKYFEINHLDKINLSNEDFREFYKKYNEFFDVVYTDPPYTDQVPYFERSQLYRDWLREFSDDSYILSEYMLKKEMIITNAPSRSINKSGELQYYGDIDDFFKNSYASLKQNGLLVLSLKLGSNKYISTLVEYINLARKNGFEFLTKYCIDKKDPTLRKQAAWKNTIAKEMIVFFTKLDSNDRYWYVDNYNLDFSITNHLYSLLSSSKEMYSLTHCISSVQNFLKQKYRVNPSESNQEKIIKVIKTNFSIIGGTFVSVDSNKVYAHEENTDDIFVKLYDIIPIIIKKLTNIDGFTLDDLYFEIVNTLLEGNGVILETLLKNSDYQVKIKNMLSNYCDLSDDSKYYPKDAFGNYDNVSDISIMDGYEFEELIKNLYKKKGYYDVYRIGGAGDRGVDIIAKHKNEYGIEEKVIIQCKRWIGNVSGTPIQRLHSMREQLNVSKAICITTSNYTEDAIKEAKSTKVELINGLEIINELERYYPGKFVHLALKLI